jgi:hypothetical protein
MVLLPSLSTAALCTCALSIFPFLFFYLEMGAGCWLMPIDCGLDFHQSTPEITALGLIFVLNWAESGVSTMIHNAANTAASHWFQFCVFASCYVLRCTRHLTLNWQGIILFLILTGQVPLRDSVKHPGISIFCTVIVSKYRVTVLLFVFHYFLCI